MLSQSSEEKDLDANSHEELAPFTVAAAPRIPFTAPSDDGVSSFTPVPLRETSLLLLTWNAFTELE